MTTEQKDLLLKADEESVTEIEVDSCNKHHLDWRGLIEKGIEVGCTYLNIHNYEK